MYFANLTFSWFFSFNLFFFWIVVFWDGKFLFQIKINGPGSTLYIVKINMATFVLPFHAHSLNGLIYVCSKKFTNVYFRKHEKIEYVYYNRDIKEIEKSIK